MIRISAFFLILVSLTTFAKAPQPKLIVCYPGKGGILRQARRSVKKMTAILGRLAGFSEGSYTADFITQPDACKKALQDESVHFVIPTLEFFLTYREKFHLKPLAVPSIKGSSTTRWYVLVKKGTFQDLKELKGKRLGGATVKMPLLLKKLVFGCRLDPSTYFHLESTGRTLRDLRRLNRGQLDAVIVDSREYESLKSLDFGKDLSAIYTSEPEPLSPVLAVDERAKDKAASFQKALLKFCSDSEGKGFCEIFGIDSFVPVKKGFYRDVKKAWDACK